MPLPTHDLSRDHGVLDMDLFHLQLVLFGITRYFEQKLRQVFFELPREENLLELIGS
jgi:hypothetical protein